MFNTFSWNTSYQSLLLFHASEIWIYKWQFDDSSIVDIILYVIGENALIPPWELWFSSLWFVDTPRGIPMLHTISWIMNIFAIFFILAAHEHYSIDVFVAFYITSRLFLYYHSLANNRVLRQPDCTRTRIWFPLFSYFESSIDGIVPNEYEWPHSAILRYVQHRRACKIS